MCGNEAAAVFCLSYDRNTVFGILFSKQKRIVRVGGLEISMDAHIPNDLSDSEYVSFDVQRVDPDN